MSGAALTDCAGNKLQVIENLGATQVSGLTPWLHLFFPFSLCAKSKHLNTSGSLAGRI